METKEFQYLQEVSKELGASNGSRIHGSEGLSNQLMDVIRNQKGLTYLTAYAALQYTYNRLRTESNFVQIQPDHTLTELVSRQLKQDPTQV